MTKYGHDCPLGHIGDMFFIYDVKYFKKIGFFDFNVLEMLPHRLSGHGILALLIIAKVGISKMYLYDNHTRFKYWDGKPKNPFRGRANPSAFDKETGFLHVNVGSFLGNSGKWVQAFYLKKYNLTKGKHIKEFLIRYYVPKKRLFYILNCVEEELQLKLRFLGFPFLRFGRFGRDFRKMQWYIDSPLKKKIRYWFFSVVRTLWESTISKFGVTIFPEYSVWPESLESFYSNVLNPEDYPDKSMVWFKKKGKKHKKKPIYRGFDVYF